MNIYVGNIPYSMNEEALNSLFGEYGEVKSTKIIMDRETGRSKGYGFVVMATEADGEKAVQELNEKEIDGRSLRINKARPREERTRATGEGRY